MSDAESVAKVTLIAADEYGPALGTRFVSGALRKAGFHTTVILARGFASESCARGESQSFSKEVHGVLAELAKDSLFVGISLATPNFHKALEITRELRSRLDIPIVWGGCHVNAKPDECVQEADFICVGEGEDVAVELATRLQTQSRCDEIPGLISSDGKPSWASPIDATSIPIPDYAIDGSHFIADTENVHPITSETSGYHLSDFEYYCAPTRGCPYKCTYCINSLYFDAYKGSKRFRRRPVKQIIAELSCAVTKLPDIRRIMLDDDCFMASPKEYIEEFCREYKHHIGLPFVIRGVHPKTLSEKKLHLLCDAGLVKVRMGIQTGSERIRKMYERTWEMNEETLEAASLIDGFIQTGALKWVMYDIIVDNPWETEEDRKATFELIERLPRPFTLYVFSLCFYPGTPLYERAKTAGLISGDVFDPAYVKNIWVTQDTRHNKIFQLFLMYNISSGLQRFLARDGVLNTKLLALLGWLPQLLPEISLITGGRLRYEFNYRMVFAPETLKELLSRVDVEQRQAGIPRLVIWFRAGVRRFYMRWIAPNVLQNFVNSHPQFRDSHAVKCFKKN
ncbi:MAG: B12-binding domain-containing radical SAM protein [Planctomycetes bacterium]|nr:B12-binding domain-containing radical SAM protein [Planctomycetota bacterium]